MRTADLPRDRFEKLLEEEIETARNERRMISRTKLAKLLQENAGVPFREAEGIVDVYCDEKAPAVPTFLSSEFGTPYLKVVSGLNIVVAIGIYFGSIQMLKPGVPVWPWMVLGTIFLVSAAALWFKSLRPQKEKRLATTEAAAEPASGPRVVFTHDPLDSVQSSPPRN